MAIDKEDIIEHIKHLRTIHFSLMLFCIISLITIMSQEKSIKVENILKDIDAINSFLNAYPDGKKWIYEKIAMSSSFDPIKVKINRVNKNSKIDTDVKELYLDNIQLNSSKLGKIWGDEKSSGEINNIESFKKFWEYIQNGKFHVFNNYQNYDALVKPLKTAELYQTPIESTKQLGNFFNNTFTENVSLSIESKVVINEKLRDPLKVKTTVETSLKNPTIHVALFDPEKLTHNIIVYFEHNPKKFNTKSLAIRDVSIIPIPTESGDLFVAQFIPYKSKWRPFERTFPYLSQLDTYYHKIPAKELKFEFLDELKKKERKIEFIGLKIPEKVLKKTAPFIIILICLYYLIHFSRYLSIRNSDQQDIFFPWTGSYDDILSKSVHSFTLVIIPGFTIYYLQANVIWFIIYVVVGIFMIQQTHFNHINIGYIKETFNRLKKNTTTLNENKSGNSNNCGQRKIKFNNPNEDG